MMEPSVSLRPPFDYADADIISRACDGINFHLYKNIVAKASTVFGDMFSLPTDPDAQPEIPQTVPLTEDADTLERLFRLCLPVVPSQFHPVHRNGLVPRIRHRLPVLSGERRPHRCPSTARTPYITHGRLRL